MPDVTVPGVPVLATVRGVEIMHTGTWDISTGTWTFTADDLAQAVAALDCPAVRRPVLKLGHEGAVTDAEPALGSCANLATTDEGQTLVCDYVGMPAWLADTDAAGNSVLSSAYPDRSIEGEYEYRCQIGHTHPFVIHAVALLGTTRPGIGTLPSLVDVATLYGVAASIADTGPQYVTLTVRAAQEAAMPAPRPTAVAATVTSEDVRRAYYAEAPYSMWICEVQLDPALQLIVTNDEDGSYSRVAVAISGDTITFADAVPVEIQYVDKPAKPAASTARGPLRYATRAESRPDAPPRATPQPPASEPDPSAPTTEETAMALDEGVRQRLGLPADADEATILAALDTALTPSEPTEPPADPAPTPALPDGVVAVDAATLENLRTAAAQGVAARAQQLGEQRDGAIRDAVRAGKIPPARAQHWASAWDADPDGTRQTLASLAPGLVPVADTGTPGYTGGDSESSEEALYGSLFGEPATAGKGA